MGARVTPPPTLSLKRRGLFLLPLPLRERPGVRSAAALTVTLMLNACGTPTGCLANRYDAAAPQTRCISGIQLPGNILKDTDPMSGSTAPVTVAR